MGFSITASAQCDYCGQLLSSSDEDCDHNGQPVDTRVFRRLSEGRDSLVGVEATPSWKWHKLAEDVGDDWIAYQYLGTKEQVNGLLQSPMWDSVRELPQMGTSLSAPNDVFKHIEE